MADKSQQTEKPTQRHLDKARREGQFPVSREFVSAVQFTTFVLLAGLYGRDLTAALAETFRFFAGRAFALAAASGTLTPRDCVLFFSTASAKVFGPLLAVGAGLAAASVAAHLAVTRLGFSTKNLTPDFARLNPARKLRELKSHNIPQFLQALVLLPVFCYAVWSIATGNLASYLRLPFQGIESGARLITATINDFLWKAAAVILLWGLIDLVRQKRRFTRDLRMSKQQIKDEHKESEGNPQVKSRIRRIQRDLLRRRMMQEVPTATAVVVNPTHYAVAIRYRIESMAAPVVVAKGKNYLALRIRQKALDNQVPIVENPPLAQALYKSADVGQEIPPALFRAVAEILAYIFKLQNRRR